MLYLHLGELVHEWLAELQKEVAGHHALDVDVVHEALDCDGRVGVGGENLLGLLGRRHEAEPGLLVGVGL